MREEQEPLGAEQAGVDLEEEMRAVARRIAKLPVLDSRSADGILGFDEHGLLD
jgi:antitoxin VapB